MPLNTAIQAECAAVLIKLPLSNQGDLLCGKRICVSPNIINPSQKTIVAAYPSAEKNRPVMNWNASLTLRQQRAIQEDVPFSAVVGHRQLVPLTG